MTSPTQQPPKDLTNQKTLFSLKRSLISLLAFTLILSTWLGYRLIFPNQPTFAAGLPPTNIGINQSNLTSCPITPNCVSTQAKDSAHYIEPISYNSTESQTFNKLKDIISAIPRTKIIKTTDNYYIYAQSSSFLMGFVDDLEFLLDPTKKVIQIRSASRLGESDLGVNRHRIETIRSKLTTPS